MATDSDAVENANTINVDGDNVYHVSPSAYMVFYRLIEADDLPVTSDGEFLSRAILKPVCAL